MYEVEIKSLLGSKENAEGLKQRLHAMFPDTKLAAKERQLNHYFNKPDDLLRLEDALVKIVPQEAVASLKNILEHGHKMSIRTRDAAGKIILVIKASVGDDTSSNGVKRIEFEAAMTGTLDALDQVLLACGCTYQAKWSREREEYQTGDIHVCIDKNAGYGYVAEFEKMTKDEKSLEKTKQDLLSMMASLGVTELPQDRLERMFGHYNIHWSEYYGTDKTFTVK